MYSDKNRIKSLLTTAIKEMQLLSAMTEPIKTANDFGLNLNGMTIFRAAGMSLQYITETFVKVRTLSGMKILSNYNNIPWQDVFGMRNFLSHQYVEVDAAGIFSTMTGIYDKCEFLGCSKRRCHNQERKEHHRKDLSLHTECKINNYSSNYRNLAWRFIII